MVYGAAQIQAAFEYDEDYSWESIAYGDGPETLTLNGEQVPVEHIVMHGGEGEGDSAWFVIKVGEQYFRMDGYYASHYGFDWDTPFYEVTPQERTIVVYE